jgi:hypothetical protein
MLKISSGDAWASCDRGNYPFGKRRVLELRDCRGKMKHGIVKVACTKRRKKEF